MAGRPVGEKKFDERVEQVLFLANNADKVAKLINASIVDAKNRIESANRVRSEALRKFEADKAVTVKMMTDAGLNEETAIMIADRQKPAFDDSAIKADVGRVNKGEALINAINELSEGIDALEHFVTSSVEGKDLVNAQFR